MTNKKNSSSVSKAVKGKEIIYLSSQDEEQGLDIMLDLQGYTIEAI